MCPIILATLLTQVMHIVSFSARLQYQFFSQSVWLENCNNGDATQLAADANEKTFLGSCCAGWCGIRIRNRNRNRICICGCCIKGEKSDEHKANTLKYFGVKNNLNIKHKSTNYARRHFSKWMNLSVYALSERTDETDGQTVLLEMNARYDGECGILNRRNHLTTKCIRHKTLDKIESDIKIDPKSLEWIYNFYFYCLCSAHSFSTVNNIRAATQMMITAYDVKFILISFILISVELNSWWLC